MNRGPAGDPSGAVVEGNWGRWGADDERGALNLIDGRKRVQAAGLVRTGRTVSLSRPLPTAPGGNNPQPALHYFHQRAADALGILGDFVGLAPHGMATTHVDALCHLWGETGMWNGRDPTEHVSAHRPPSWGGLHHWRDGIVTRGVLLDVPRHRGTDYVTLDRPVTGGELAGIAERAGVEVMPGDAVVVHCGREAWERAQGPYGDGIATASLHVEKPGLDASCLAQLASWDCAALVWDMLDASGPDQTPLPVHQAIPLLGLALVDNAALELLSRVTGEVGREEFMLVVAPLYIQDGTGSAVNPLAIF